MMFKGYRFVHARKVVTLPRDPTDPKGNFVKFGRMCAPTVKGAVRTEWHLSGGAVWAKPIPLKGHSLTNMAYGTDGRVYLAYDGACFSTFTKSPAERGEAKLLRRLAREQAAREQAVTP